MSLTKKFSYIFLVIGLIFILMLLYLEVLPAVSQYMMRAYWKDNNQRERLLKVEKKGPDHNQLGIISIPKIEVEQVVLYGANPENLDLGPGLIKGTAYPGTKGNAVIAGHRVSHGHPFRDIDELKKGDKIIFRNSSGKLTYTVTKKFRVLPANHKVLHNTLYPQITLSACDPPYSAKYRLIIQAVAKNYVAGF